MRGEVSGVFEGEGGGGWLVLRDGLCEVVDGGQRAVSTFLFSMVSECFLSAVVDEDNVVNQRTELSCHCLDEWTLGQSSGGECNISKVDYVCSVQPILTSPRDEWPTFTKYPSIFGGW